MNRSSSGENQHRARLSSHQLQERALELLEFTKIRESLAQHTTLAIAKERAYGLTPAYTAEGVHQLQRETTDAAVLLQKGGPVDLSGASDIRPLLQRATLGGVLSGEELLTVLRTVETLRQAKRAVQRLQGRLPALRASARNIPDLRPLEKEIHAKIDDGGRVVDAATPYLHWLRQETRHHYQQLMHTLTEFAHSPTGREVLQDDFITLRSDRMVVPVKAQLRSQVPGIVHGVSDSGATLFIEPFFSVDACNKWREVVAEEEAEVQRVLRALSTGVRRRSEDVHLGLDLTAHLDLVLAKARYAQALNAEAAQSVSGDQLHVRLVQARHPLLPGPVVPITLHIGPGWPVLVITGPNTGGKTVALKTVGLLALMHQAGLWVPADPSTCFPVFDGVYADIGDRQSIEASISTFSSHVTNIVDILGAATTHSLVLLDELGTSTDPEEGSALAKAILTHLSQRGVFTMATTHHRSVAAFVEQQEGMTNASVELDPETLRPTYKLTMGLPGRSYALPVAEQLDLDPQILDTAQDLLDPRHVRTEALLAQLQEEGYHTRLKLQQAEEMRNQAQALQRKLEQELEDLAQQRDALMDQTRRRLQTRARETLRLLRQAGRGGQHHEEARQQVEEAQRLLRSRLWRPTPERVQRRRAAFQPGDAVELSGLGFKGQVLSAPAQDGKVEVLVGSARVTLDASRLRRLDTSEMVSAPPPPTQVHLRPEHHLAGPEPELDLRGLRAQEALERLDNFLDRALAQSCRRVRVVHGRGTGALRQAIWRHLGSHPIAASYSPAEPEHGGDGATMVELK